MGGPPVDIRLAALRSMRRLLPRMHLAGYSSSIMHPLIRCLPPAATSAHDTAPLSTSAGSLLPAAGQLRHAKKKKKKGEHSSTALAVTVLLYLALFHSPWRLH